MPSLGILQESLEKCDPLSIGASLQNIVFAAAWPRCGTFGIANTCFAYDELVDFR